ncbi:MAG: flippase [Methanosarcina sp.]
MFKLSKTIRDIQWSFISLATSSLSHLFLRILLSRELGASGLGLYTLVFTIYMFGIQFAAFGIGSALTKYIAEYCDEPLKIKEFVSSGIVGAIISGSLMGITLYLLAGIISTQFFHNSNMTELLRITALCFPFIAIQKVIIGILNGLRRMQSYAFLNILQNLSIMVVTVILVFCFDMDVMGAIIGFVAPTIIIGLLSLTFARNYFEASFNIVHSVIKEISYFGFYIILAGSIEMINTQIDSVLIGHFMTETDVGYYAVAVIFVQGIILIPQTIQSVTTPLIATYYGKKDLESIQKLIKRTMFNTFIVAVFISFGLIIFGKSLITFIFTEEYLPAYMPMVILLIGHTVCAPIGSIGTTLSCVGQVRVIFRITTICALMNTILNLLLIPKYGIIGASIATSLSQIGTLLIHFHFIKKYVFD